LDAFIDDYVPTAAAGWAGLEEAGLAAADLAVAASRAQCPKVLSTDAQTQNGSART
jgi:hypothetical protein